jgi:hypothetical protein
MRCRVVRTASYQSYGYGFWEVKNWGYIHASGQIQGEAELALQMGVPFNLVVGKYTIVNDNVRALIRSTGDGLSRQTDSRFFPILSPDVMPIHVYTNLLTRERLSEPELARKMLRAFDDIAPGIAPEKIGYVEPLTHRYPGTFFNLPNNALEQARDFRRGGPRATPLHARPSEGCRSIALHCVFPIRRHDPPAERAPTYTTDDRQYL